MPSTLPAANVRAGIGHFGLLRYPRAIATTGAVFLLAGSALWLASVQGSGTGQWTLAAMVCVVGLYLGIAVVQADRLKSRTRERDQLAEVVAASTAIAGSTLDDALLERLVETATTAVGRTRGELYVYARDGSLVESAAFFGFTTVELETMRALSEYNVGIFPAETRAIATHSPTIEDIDEPGLNPALTEQLRGMGKHRTLVSPLLAHGGVVGLFAAWTPHSARPFDEADIQAASIISRQAGLAIYNSRLLADARRQADEHGALLRVSQASVSSTDMREVLRRIAQASLGIAGAESCGVDLWMPETQQIEVVSEETIAEWPGTCEPGTRFNLDDRPAMRRVFEEQAPLILSADDPNLAEEIHDWLFTEDTRSVLIFPLMIGGECLGALNMYSRELQAFSVADLRIVSEIADKAALGVQSARLFASTRRYADEQAALLRVSQAVVSGQDLVTTLHEVARSTVGVADAEGCEIELYDGSTGMLDHVAHHFVDGWNPASGAGEATTYPASDWPASLRALKQLAPVSFTTDELAHDTDEGGRFAADGIRSVVIVPLLIGDEPIGLLSLYARQPHRFDNDTQRFASELAAQAALAIDRARLNAALRHRADSDGLTGVLNHRAVLEALDAVLANARRSGGQASILLIDLDSFKLFNDTHGHLVGDQVLCNATEILRRSIRDGDYVGRYGGDEFLVVLDRAGAREAELVAGRLLREAEEATVNVADLRLPLKLSVGIGVFPEHGTSRQELVAFADGGMYTAKESGGGQARISGRDSDHREPTTFGTLMGLVRAVDRKDRYTRVHSDLVTEVAVRFGQELGLDPEQLEALAIAGQLHDVGKIAVPDSVLRKPGALSAEETEILRQHVVFSELMVKGVPHLVSVSEAIANHHERWDGRGYPRRTAGSAIPLLARILALADAWSAMTHDRPYRKRLEHAEALTEIRNGEGTQFDPTLVEPFIAVVERMEAERRSRLRDAVGGSEDGLVATG